MTREEQIRKAAYSDKNNLHAQPHPVPGVAEMMNEYFALCFKAGAEWADQHPHWIPVEERLPEENTVPLVRMDLTDKFGEETILYDVVVFDGNGFHAPYEVTHWMEIVPPRKEE